MGFAQWLADLRWALNMMRARAHRRDLSFAQRNVFDRTLRPLAGRDSNSVIAYPDAFYHVTIDDLVRAMVQSAPYPPAEWVP